MSRVPDDQSFWLDLTEQAQIEIRNAMRVRRIARGETLVEQDAPSDALFIVNFGLFEVLNAATKRVVSEITTGELIGEIGFFAGSRRTASVVASRDSEVLEISRAEFAELTKRRPEIQGAITRALAQRLAKLAPIARNQQTDRRPGALRVAVLVGAGEGEIPDLFVQTLRKVVSRRARCCFLSSAEASARFAGPKIDRYATANWLADVERNHDLVVCVADATLTDWTHVALRSADQVLLIAHGAPAPLNQVEALALDLYPVARRRIIRLHAIRSAYAAPGAEWLSCRDVFMSHHVSLQDDDDFRSLSRFLLGRAIGFVAGGGGAFGPAHIGIHRAFCDQGIAFDIHGGSSVGAAMAGAFSLMMKPEEIRAAMAEMFVRRRALKRIAIPRYGLLDHAVLDSELQDKFGAGRVEDVWKPYFAVVADLSTYSTRVMRTGPLWQAIRASCSIPGILPPFFDDEGHMLVDGGVVDNLPVAAMSSLKRGPNLVVDIRPHDQQFFDVKYSSIPGRSSLLGRMFNPLAQRGGLPECPGPTNVIMRSVFSKIGDRIMDGESLDLMLRPPPFRGSSYMNWDRHAEVIDAAYEWCKAEIVRLRTQGNPALAAMERASSRESAI